MVRSSSEFLLMLSDPRRQDGKRVGICGRSEREPDEKGISVL